MTSKDEQETTTTWIAADDTVRVYTAVPKHLRRLRSDKRVQELAGEEEWGSFAIPKDLFDPLTGFRRTRKEMSPQQKAATVARLADARSKKGS